ncbi:hypothetical protein BC351_07645 [Paenibacillus ferrarius]|uniref:Uncharacterized protein n=1 Tax=Paenibacillus ferrarius TaxID=1469647 RepID=A0A1V4HD44_9BACL|nr:hypothetical protein [Paenibacillus ferrarius]OPH50521.1 hypothetical protein BC351_07645 [Paenibacillus ferrarius]
MKNGKACDYAGFFSFFTLLCTFWTQKDALSQEFDGLGDSKTKKDALSQEFAKIGEEASGFITGLPVQRLPIQQLNERRSRIAKTQKKTL